MLFKCVHQSELWRRTNHCVTGSRTVSFPTHLVFKLKNALSRWKSRVEMPRINDYTFLPGRNHCQGCSKRARSPRASESSPSKTPERLKKKPTGQLVLNQRSGPSLFGQGPCCCCAIARSSLLPRLLTGHWKVCCVAGAHQD